MNNNTTDRIVLLESTDGEIKITATEQRIFIVTPFNAAFKDEIKARFGARWNGSTKEWSIPFRYRDDLDPLIYNFFGVSMIAEVTTPSLMKVAIDAQRLYQVSGAGSEITLAGSRVAVRWGRDEAVKVYRGVFKKDGEDFRFPRSGGSMRRPRVAGCGELDGAILETEITPAELDWLRENEIDFELLDGGQSAEPQPEDPQLDPEDLSDLHEDDEIFMDEDEDEDHIYVQEEEEDNETEAEVEVETKSDEDEEDKEMKKYLTDGEDFMTIDPITMDDEEDEDEEPITLPQTDDDEPRMTKNSYGLNVTTWPTTEQGVHSATYLGWNGYDEIISSGGWISGEYIAPTDELGLDRAWKSLSPELKDELESLSGGDPAEWNGKILELEREGKVSPEDEELLDAFWIEGEVFNGAVTIYGTDDDVAEMDEADFSRLGLNRMDADELWHLGIVDLDEEDEDEDE